MTLPDSHAVVKYLYPGCAVMSFAVFNVESEAARCIPRIRRVISPAAVAGRGMTKRGNERPNGLATARKVRRFVTSNLYEAPAEGIQEEVTRKLGRVDIREMAGHKSLYFKDLPNMTKWARLRASLCSLMVYESIVNTT